MTYAPELWWGDFVDIRFYLTEKLTELSGQRILDLGCNAGVIASECEAVGSEVVGLDMNLDALGRYQELFSDLKLPARVVCGSWNALPSLLFWLPLSVKMQLPRKLLIYPTPPGRLVQYLPGWYKVFRFLSKFEWLWKYCRSYYLCARKV